MRNFTKINKRQARELFAKGKPIGLLPHKVGLGGMWMTPHFIVNKSKYTFDNLVDNYIYYNCNYEVGYYPAFYLQDRRQ